MAGARRRQVVGGFPVGSWGPLGGAAAGAGANLDLAAQEAGSDTLAGTASVLVQLSLASQESGSDTFAGAASVLVQLSLAAQEQGSDVFSGQASNDAEETNGGGGSFPFRGGRRGTALHSYEGRVEQAPDQPPADRAPELVPAARDALQPTAPTAEQSAAGQRAVHALLTLAPPIGPVAGDTQPSRQAVDLLLVQIEQVVLRLQLEAGQAQAQADAQAAAQAEEDDAIALMLLSTL